MSPLIATSSYDMYMDIEEKLAKRTNTAFSSDFISGLPIGLELPNGIVVGS